VPLAACGSRDGDPPVQAGVPTPLGTGSRIKQVTNPDSDKHVVNGPATITGAVFLWQDTFDETANGKSRGTIYLQDFGSTEGFSGVSLFSPTFNPSGRYSSRRCFSASRARRIISTSVSSARLVKVDTCSIGTTIT